MTSINGKTVLVTGASKGLGKALTYALVKEGAAVVGVARSYDILNSMKQELGEKFSFVIGDLSKPATIDSLVTGIVQNHKPSILINNAGAFEMDYFPLHDPKKIELLVDLNVKAPLLVYHSWLRAAFSMEDFHPELVAWLSSVSGEYGYGGNTAYAATKFALRGAGLDQVGEWNVLQSYGKDDPKVQEQMKPFINRPVRQLIWHPDSTDTDIIHNTKGNIFSDPSSYEYLSVDIVIDGMMKSILAEGDFHNAVSVEFGIRELEGKQQCAIIYPLHPDERYELREQAIVIPLAPYGQ